MRAEIKHKLSRIPVVGYALHWLVDLIKLPLIRLDFVREIQALKAAQKRAEAIHDFRHAELVEGISALRRSVGDAITQLNVLYERIAPLGEEETAGELSVGAAEARADLRRRLWAIERRLSWLERVDRPGIH